MSDPTPAPAVPPAPITAPTPTADPTVLVSPATPADADVLAAFNLALGTETEGKRLDPATVGLGVRAVLADPGKGRYFVARFADPVAEGDSAEVIGCVMITTEWSDWRNGEMWWIQSVYVRPDARRHGVFRTLYKSVIAAAKTERVPLVRLYVERDNAAARSTYARLGMTEPGYLVMEKTL